MEIKKAKFTHYASFYGIPCYFNVTTKDMAGRNGFFDFLIPIAAWIHNYFIAPFDGHGFPIRIGKEVGSQLIDAV